jgi:hydroxyacylglutathione hydrolase
MSQLEVDLFLCRQDNFGVLVHDHNSGDTASIDAPDPVTIQKTLQRKGWALTHILTTHHHGDHVEGNLALKSASNCKIVGPKAEAGKIPGIDQPVSGHDTFSFAGRDVIVIDTPGHTRGHIAFHIASEDVVFVGDTLFSLGCGRVFEGTMDEMWASLEKLKKLPQQTRIYCGHEYTESNARFALTIEPGNSDLQKRSAEVSRKRNRGELTLPTTIGEELRVNPFLRADSVEIRERLGLNGATESQVFAEIRRRKDNF